MSQTLFDGSYVNVVALDDGIVDIRLDRRGDELNKLDDHLIDDLDAALTAIAAHVGLRGALLTSAKQGFLAGADIAALQALLQQPKAAQIQFSQRMQRVLSRLENLPVPLVCAINGYALGGGLEVALCADYRVLVPAAQIGFPEVSLGILPGAGGTVRTPRLTNAATALDWVAGARNFKAEAALAAGMVDAIAEPAQLRDVALDWLRRAIDGHLDWRGRRAQRAGTFAANAAAFEAARQRAAKVAHHYPAALTVVEMLEKCAALTRDAAYPVEAENFACLCQSDTAKALVGIFISNQKLRKITKAQAGSGGKIERVAVLGAGVMGGSIAYTSALKGIPVLLKDIAQPPIDVGINEAKKLLAKQVETGRLKQDKADAILAAIKPTLAFEDFETIDFVVEAVVENLKIKRDVLTTVESLVRPGTPLASNTSSLSIAEIAGPLQRAEDVIGMHFFNPVHLMPLVEVIRSDKSGDAAIGKAITYAMALGKTPLVVKDCPGFLVNRLLGAYFSAFLLLVRDGADFRQIDRAMEAWGWPMGPAVLFDMAGIDMLDKAMAILAKAYPDVMGADYTTAFRLLTQEGRHGQKTGAGFYRHEADAKGRPVRIYDEVIAGLLATVQPNGTRDFGEQEIVDRMMLPMILEAARCFDERVVGTVIEIDAGMRLGTAFPAHYGGPLWYADCIGLNEVVRRCEPYRTLGGLYRAGEGLLRFAKEGKRFYDTAN